MTSYAYCDRCKRLFIGVQGSQFVHRCTKPKLEEETFVAWKDDFVAIDVHGVTEILEAHE